MNPQGLETTTFTTGCQVLQDKGLAIVGMSPGNSYFKKDTIERLLVYCSEVFSQVKIMVADVPMEHTYRAMGYTDTKAKKKARLNGNTLQNHSTAAIVSHSLENVALLEWIEEIHPHSAYERELKRLEKLYASHGEFCTQVRHTTAQVLEGKLKKNMAMEDAIDVGVHYLLKELAFLSAAPELFGVDKVAYVYHDRWPIYENFVGGKFNGEKREDLGFVIINQP